MRPRAYAAAAAVLAAASLIIAAGGGPAAGQGTSAPVGPTCEQPTAQFEGLAEKGYDSHRWWADADPTPLKRSEEKRMDALLSGACDPQALLVLRSAAKGDYWRYYRKNIGKEVCADGRRWANCAVATCESTLGRGGNILYGFLDYWHSESPLPVKGNGSGTRFAPSASAASKLEQDVVAAAAFKYGPTPSTCAS
jgi:hypothetical protein